MSVEPVFVTSDIGMLITAVLTGSGLAYVLREQVAEYLESGR
jgi:DNA-binding transcriptional LysR family regulator